MHNQAQGNQMMTKDRRYLQMRKAVLKLLFDCQFLKQTLEHNQSSERSQSLIFKSNIWNLVFPAHYFHFARLHLRWPPVLDILGSDKLQFIQSGDHFSIL